MKVWKLAEVVFLDKGRYNDNYDRDSWINWMRTLGVALEWVWGIVSMR